MLAQPSESVSGGDRAIESMSITLQFRYSESQNIQYKFSSINIPMVTILREIICEIFKCKASQHRRVITFHELHSSEFEDPENSLIDGRISRNKRKIKDQKTQISLYVPELRVER